MGRKGNGDRIFGNVYKPTKQILNDTFYCIGYLLGKIICRSFCAVICSQNPLKRENVLRITIMHSIIIRTETLALGRS
jgi:hypothetical protein